MAFDLTPDEPLEGDLDPQSDISLIPAGHSMKGMFFARYVAILSERFEAISGSLKEPPRFGKYVPFAFYPLADFVTLFDLVARDRYAHLSPREAHRQLAQSELDAFLRSTLGRVTFSMLHDPVAALMKYPEAFSVLARGPLVSSERAGEREVLVHYEEYFGSREYAYGVVEAIVQNFECEPWLKIVETGPRAFSIRVSWIEEKTNPRTPSIPQ